jgi:hypothetical protein
MAKYLDINGLNRFLDKIKGLLNLKADKTDTYTKSEVDALVAEGGGGSDEDDFIIPEDTYKQSLHGNETAYALSGITTKEITLRIISPEDRGYTYNGFAFQTHSKDIQFDVGYKDYSYDCVYMEQVGDKYYFSSDSIGDPFTKSLNRRFHTFYWTHAQIKCDLKKVADFGHYSSDSPVGDELDIHIKSLDTEFTIINYSQTCNTLYARPTSNKYLYDIIVFDKYEVDYITVSTVDIRNAKLHFSAFSDNALPKHQNIYVTNNSIKPAYYANKMYFVTTNKTGSCFDLVGGFHDSFFSKLDNFDTKRCFQNEDGVLIHKLYDVNSSSLFVTGDLSSQEKEFVIRLEEPPIPMNKKGYIYDNGLIYLGTNVDATDLLTRKYSACIYRYRKNARHEGFRYIKYRKIKGVLENRKLWGNLYVQSKSKTGVRSVFTNVMKVGYNFREERLTMVKT